MNSAGLLLAFGLAAGAVSWEAFYCRRPVAFLVCLAAGFGLGIRGLSERAALQADAWYAPGALASVVGVVALVLCWRVLGWSRRPAGPRHGTRGGSA
jgi:hypothetical protein